MAYMDMYMHIQNNIEEPRQLAWLLMRRYQCFILSVIVLFIPTSLWRLLWYPCWSHNRETKLPAKISRRNPQYHTLYTESECEKRKTYDYLVSKIIEPL